MSKFSINFGSFNYIPNCKVWIDRRFHGFHALNFSNGGEFYWAQGPGWKRELIPEPVAWWTVPGKRYVYGCESEGKGWDHRYVTFRGELVREWRKSGLWPRDRESIRRVNEPRLFHEKMNRLIFLLSKKTVDRACVVLQDMILDLGEPIILKSASDPVRDKIVQLMLRFQERAEEEMDEVLEAKRVGLSKVQFRRVFSSMAGMPPRRYVIKCRVETAEALLRGSLLPIKEIAGMSGFHDEYYFNRMFKMHFGCPPGRYREMAQLRSFPVSPGD